MEDLTKEPKRLLEACLSWQPGSIPFEQTQGARDFASDDPEKLEQMRLLGLILGKYRKPVVPNGSNVKKP